MREYQEEKKQEWKRRNEKRRETMNLKGDRIEKERREEVGEARERKVQWADWKEKKPIKGKTAQRNPFSFSYLSFFHSYYHLFILPLFPLTVRWNPAFFILYVKRSGSRYISTLELAELIAFWRVALSACVCVCVGGDCVLCNLCTCVWVCYSITARRTQSYGKNNLKKNNQTFVQQKHERERQSKQGLSDDSWKQIERD